MASAPHAPDTETCDVLVIGSGAGGLTAALAASDMGLAVRVIEKAPVIGGTTALSEGMIWVPDNAPARRAGKADSAEAALRYMEAVVGRHFDRARAERFVEAAPRMLDFVETRSHARFTLAGSCDYFPDAPGATRGARSFDPDPFDGRRLGPDFRRLRFPLATTTILGGLSITMSDLPHFLAMTRSARSFLHVLGTLGRYALDRLMGQPRGTRIGGGNALVARLLLSLKERGVAVETATPARRLLIEKGAVVGAEVERDRGAQTIRARHGVVLACGGFPAADELKRAHYPHVRAGKAHVRLAPAENTGDGIALGQGAGAAFATDLAQPAAWAPVSVVPQRNGPPVPFPHFIDRNKPGFLIVDRRGRRFVNESTSYHLIVQAMATTCAADPEIEAFVVADHRAIRRYSIGVVPPSPGRLGPHLRSGYLKRGRTPGELAQAIGVDAGALTATVARFNESAGRGEDPDFGRGRSAYDRTNGDPEHAPNPCLGPLVTPPYYAVRIVPGDLGTFFGLRCDADARVLDEAGAPIAGLYAAGNDMASLMGGTYPAAGITIGAAMTFGYVAAEAISGRARDAGWNAPPAGVRPAALALQGDLR